MKKPIAIFITDTHLKIGNIKLVKDIFEQFINLAKKLNVKFLIHGGDFFNSRSSQSLDCLLAAYDIFHMFEDHNLELDIITGNHDKQSLIESISYVSIFKKMNNIKVYENESYKIDLENKVVYCFLSYFKEGIVYLEKLINLIDLIKNNKQLIKYKKVLITHISTNKAKNNDGSLVDGDIELEYFDFFDLVLKGHYHDRQYLSDKVVYIGAAYQGNYGEDENKGFTVLYDDLSLKYIKSKFPAYKKLYIDAKDKEQALELLEQHANTEDNVRFIFKGKKEDLEAINPLKFNDKNIDVKFENVENYRDFEELEEAEPIKFTKSSIIKFWFEYCSNNNLTPEQKTKGMKLLTAIK